MAEETLALDAADGSLRELAKLGKVLLSAESIVRKAQVAQRAIASYEQQATRLRDTLTTDRQTLDGLRGELGNEAAKLKLAQDATAAAEGRRDQKVRECQNQEDAQTARIRAQALRDREAIARDTSALAAELDDTRKKSRGGLELARTNATVELHTIETEVQTAKDELERVKAAHREFVDSISGPAVHGGR